MIERPDIVLVVWDTARAADLSLYGFPADTTPFLAQLGRESLVYERAVSPSPWCIPSHGSLFTGRLPSQHGATELSWHLPEETPTLAALLSAAGYHTVGISANDLVSRAYGLDRGFDSFHTVGESVPVGGRRRMRGRRAAGDRDAAKVNRMVEREIGQAPDDRPLFLFVNHLDAHLRYWAPRPWRFRFLPPWAKQEDAERIDQSPLHHFLGRTTLDERDLDVMRTLYQGELRFLDERLEEIVQLLRFTGRWDRTVLAVTADHGENIGDHGLLGHQWNLYQTVLWVPLLLRIPNGPGGRLGQLVQTHDLFPTLLELGEAEPPELTDAGRLPTRDEAGRVYAVSEYLAPFPPAATLRQLYPDGGWERLERGLRAAQDKEGAKLIAATDGGTELYDLIKDPHETESVAERLPISLARLRKILRTTPRPRHLPDREPELDEETLARLRELGELD